MILLVYDDTGDLKLIDVSIFEYDSEEKSVYITSSSCDQLYIEGMSKDIYEFYLFKLYENGKLSLLDDSHYIVRYLEEDDD